MTAFGGALDDPTKVLGSRIGAFIVDSILITVVVFTVFALWRSNDYLKLDTGRPGVPTCAEINGPLAAAGDSITPGFAGSDPDLNGGQPIPLDGATCFQLGSTAYVLTPSQASTANATINGLFAALSFANAVVLQSLGGATIGKRLFGLRVVIPTGQTAGMGRNTVRWLLMIVDGACCFLPGLIAANTSKGHRRIGDMAAGTYVVHRSAVGRILRIPGHVTVRQKHEFGTAGPAPVQPELTVAEGGGLDAPAWDPARNAYVRYDPASGVWFQWDDDRQAWVPVQA